MKCIHHGWQISGGLDQQSIVLPYRTRNWKWMLIGFQIEELRHHAPKRALRSNGAVLIKSIFGNGVTSHPTYAKSVSHHVEIASVSKFRRRQQLLTKPRIDPV